MDYNASQLSLARSLLSHAQCCAVAAIGPLETQLSEYGCISRADLEPSWLTLFAIAGVGVAFTEIADDAPATDQAGLARAIKVVLEEWHPQMYSTGLLGFLDTYRHCVTKENLRPDAAIGSWLWSSFVQLPETNVAVRQLAADERNHHVVGHMVLSMCHGFWRAIYGRSFTEGRSQQ